MPLGTNEHQVVIEFFTSEDPAVKIQPEAKAFIAGQKWISPEVIYNDQKEEIDENGVQWYSVVFVLGVILQKKTKNGLLMCKGFWIMPGLFSIR